MEYSFPRYLLAKQSVDDRALNRHVLDALKANLPTAPIRIMEVGAGMGNMLARLLSWDILMHAEYVHVDAMEENIRFAQDWIPKWARGQRSPLCRCPATDPLGLRQVPPGRKPRSAPAEYSRRPYP